MEITLPFQLSILRLSRLILIYMLEEFVINLTVEKLYNSKKIQRKSIIKYGSRTVKAEESQFLLRSISSQLISFESIDNGPQS